MLLQLISWHDTCYIVMFLFLFITVWSDDLCLLSCLRSELNTEPIPGLNWTRREPSDDKTLHGNIGNRFRTGPITKPSTAIPLTLQYQYFGYCPAWVQVIFLSIPGQYGIKIYMDMSNKHCLCSFISFYWNVLNMQNIFKDFLFYFKPFYFRIGLILMVILTSKVFVLFGSMTSDRVIENLKNTTWEFLVPIIICNKIDICMRDPPSLEKNETENETYIQWKKERCSAICPEFRGRLETCKGSSLMSTSPQTDCHSSSKKEH